MCLVKRCDPLPPQDYYYKVFVLGDEDTFFNCFRLDEEWRNINSLNEYYTIGCQCEADDSTTLTFLNGSDTYQAGFHSFLDIESARKTVCFLKAVKTLHTYVICKVEVSGITDQGYSSSASWEKEGYADISVVSKWMKIVEVIE